jgi:uncharacterized protein
MDEPEIKYKVSTRRKVMRWATVIVFIYASAGIALYYLQEKFLFHPDPLPKDFEFKFKLPFREANIPMNARDTVNMIQFYPANVVARGVVLYFHGNRGNVIRYEKYANNFLKNGYEVWVPDFPTYGKTTGKLSEENMYLQAKEVYNLAHSKFSADSIIVYGKSLGTGVAAYVAAKKKCRMLILETPYYSIPDLFSSYAPIYPTGRMSHFKFPVGDYLKDVNAPVFIFHGTADETIPYRGAAKLKKVLKPGDEFITIEKGKHNNLDDYPVFHQKLDSVLNL